jgi:hypothetical protein
MPDGMEEQEQLDAINHSMTANAKVKRDAESSDRLARIERKLDDILARMGDVKQTKVTK